MATEKFREKVEQELKNLDREQVVQFAWRCAMRALPYLGMDGNFNFWNNKDKQKHIYAILNAMDFVAAAFTASVSDDNATAASDVVDNATATAASDVVDNASASFASYASAYASIAFSTSNNVAYIYAAYAAEGAASADQLNLKPVILQDIKSIYVGGRQIISAAIYGQIWDNFQKALKDEGCTYWAKLYQEIFDNNFEMDREALGRRMNVPEEIRKQGAAAVGNYLEELEKGATRLNEARIIILGDKGAGKTCIARRLVDPNAKMTTDDESTAGVDTSLWKPKKENINVRIWDFAGHTVTHAVHQFFLSERCLYLLIYDGRTEERNRLEYWLNHMKNYGGNSKAIILVNERDRHSVDIKINNLKEKYPIEAVYRFSIKDNKTKLESFRKDVVEYIKSNPSWEKQEIPTSYYQVKEDLEKLFINGNKNNEHIKKDKFDRIAKKYNVENIDKLLEGLHSLGVSLWYKDMDKFDTLILNPEWISHGVYKIINWINEEKRHDISLKDFIKVYDKDAKRYPKDKHEFLFNLMKHYELAFETDKKKCLIIPHLLNEDRPVDLPDFPVGDSLMLRYAAEQALPSNTISRFIVRHNEEIKKENKKYIVWRYGVVLEDGKGSEALVREDDRTISVSVKGKDKTNYISTLRETLNDIFNTYISEKPELQYKIVRFGEIPDTNELWLPDRKIKNLYGKDKPYYDDETDQDISMGGVVTTYNINAPNTTIVGHDIDNSTHNTFNFKDCNIGLQGNLNELAQKLTESGNSEDANELENTAKAFKAIKDCENKEEIKETGIGNRLKRMVEELGDEGSKLHKTVKGIKHGIGIAQDIAKTYNDIAQWAGLPQVPKPFLKK
ncbi:MAG: hypothetical protein GQ564_22090 [Bacteroidales bacterium]|nr:hypothetical protein [Bacteroidales bacterium]